MCRYFPILNPETIGPGTINAPENMVTLLQPISDHFGQFQFVFEALEGVR